MNRCNFLALLGLSPLGLIGKEQYHEYIPRKDMNHIDRVILKSVGCEPGATWIDGKGKKWIWAKCRRNCFRDVH